MGTWWDDVRALAARLGRTPDAVLWAWRAYTGGRGDAEQWYQFCELAQLDALDPAWYERPPDDAPPPAEPPT